MKVGDLVRLKLAPTQAHKKYVGQLAMVVREAPNKANIDVALFSDGHIGLLAKGWFELVSESEK